MTGHIEVWLAGRRRALCLKDRRRSWHAHLFREVREPHLGRVTDILDRYRSLKV